MKGIMITAPSSNTGKTTLTLGLIRALKKRNWDVSGFKTGPDYIDTKYLALASGKEAANLDMHLMGRENLKLALGLNPGQIAIVEGAMGYFDGIYNSYENSSYDISRQLDLPAILVYRPQGEMFSSIPKIKGMVDFSQGRIKGIILNKTSKSTYDLLKPQIEKYLGLKVLGHLEETRELEISQDRLGLDNSSDQAMESLIETTSILLEKSLDLDGLEELLEEVDYSRPRREKKTKKLRLALARDSAFCFFYHENLRLLEEDFQIEYFSPLEDEVLPQADLVILGGGYPEKYLDKLSANHKMKESIRAYVEAGGYLIGEGAGLMYLASSIEDRPMLGIIPGDVELLDRLNMRFGYTIMELKENTIYGPAGTVLYGNEYHKSQLRTQEDAIMHISKPMATRTWQCGYQYKNVLAYYGHINYLGNQEALGHLVKLLEGER